MPAHSLRISAAARSDVREALEYSAIRFGSLAKGRYSTLIAQVLDDISTDPRGTGSRERPDLGEGIIARHLASRARGSGISDPRHIVFYRVVADHVDVLRVLHDARDLQRLLTSMD